MAFLLEISGVLNTELENNFKGDLVSIADAGTDGSFLSEYFLCNSLKLDHGVCFVGLAQSFNHYNNVAQKIGEDLASARDSGKLIFVEGMKMLGKAICDQALGNCEEANPFSSLAEDGSLKQLYDFLLSEYKRLKEQSTSGPVLIIDSLGVLLNVDVSVADLISFIHMLKNAVLADGDGTVVLFLSRNKEDEEIENLWRFLVYSSSLTLVVSGLESGYCRDVHGELMISRRSGMTRLRKASKERLQFKLTEKTISFFAPGLSDFVM